MGLRDWAVRDLRTGDLSGLAAIARGATERDQERVRRLAHRGLVASTPDGKIAITPAGRLALFIRR